MRCGELRVTGALESVELACYDQAARRWKPPRSLDGGFELLHLTGTIGEESGALGFTARAALMRDRDTGVEVIGGHVARATVFAVEFVIECFDDLVLRRQPDAATGLPRWAEVIAETEAPEAPAPEAPTPTPAPAPTPTPMPTPTPTLTPEVVVHAGDVLAHPKFGRTTIMRIEGDQEFVHVRLRNGRVVRLSLDVMTLLPRGTEEGQRVFEARMG